MRLSAADPRWLGRALDALLPPHCATCESPVAAQGTLCPGCWRGLHFLGAPLCDRCGVPFLHAGQGMGGICAGCAARPPRFACARGALRYDEGARRLILPFKHGDRPDLARPLAAWMARAGAAQLGRCDVILPVPLHWRRLMRRRYNQALLLARHLGATTGLPVLPDTLRRLRATPPLEGRGAAERAEVLAGVFGVSARGAARVAGRRVLLVDDVMTSGATAEACATALLAAGAATVEVLAAARVPDPRLERPGS
jgi:ComF family protein